MFKSPSLVREPTRATSVQEDPYLEPLETAYRLLAFSAGSRAEIEGAIGIVRASSDSQRRRVRDKIKMDTDYKEEEKIKLLVYVHCKSEKQRQPSDVSPVPDSSALKVETQPAFVMPETPATHNEPALAG